MRKASLRPLTTCALLRLPALFVPEALFCWFLLPNREFSSSLAFCAFACIPVANKEAIKSPPFRIFFIIMYIFSDVKAAMPNHSTKIVKFGRSLIQLPGIQDLLCMILTFYLIDNVFNNTFLIN
ncbi:hypothetical protein D3C86_1657850 [compost metagenome]